MQSNEPNTHSEETTRRDSFLQEAFEAQRTDKDTGITSPTARYHKIGVSKLLSGTIRDRVNLPSAAELLLHLSAQFATLLRNTRVE